MIEMKIDKNVLGDIESKHKIYFKEKIKPKLEREIANFSGDEKDLLEYLNRNDIFEDLCCGEQNKLVDIIKYINKAFEHLLIMNLLYEINRYFYELFKDLDDNEVLTINTSIKKEGIKFLDDIDNLYIKNS